MGMFDTFSNREGTLEVQLKAGRCLLNVFTEGDRCDHGGYENGIYHAPEGVVVITGGTVRYVAEKAPPSLDPELPRFTKWGGPFDPETEKLETYHPLAVVVARATGQPLVTFPFRALLPERLVVEKDAPPFPERFAIVLTSAADLHALRRFCAETLRALPAEVIHEIMELEASRER